MNAFYQALDFTLGVEGGYVDHPDDPGGATKWGITQKTYDRWRKQNHLPLQAVKLMVRNDMEDIYFAYYWAEGNCELMPSTAIKMAHFDAVVNHGVRRGAKLLQKSVNAKPDGIIGPKTIAATAMGGFEDNLLWERAIFYVRISPSPPVFLKGWMRRLFKLRAAIREL